MTTVTVLAGPERRRRWSAGEKLRIVAESLAAEASVAEVARRHDVHPNLVHLWRRQARTGVLSVAADGEARFAPVAVAAANSVARPLGSGVGPVIEVVPDRATGTPRPFSQSNIFGRSLPSPIRRHAC